MYLIIKWPVKLTLDNQTINQISSHDLTTRKHWLSTHFYVYYILIICIYYLRIQVPRPLGQPWKVFYITQVLIHLVYMPLALGTVAVTTRLFTSPDVCMNLKDKSRSFSQQFF